MHEITGNEPSAISWNSHSYIQISSCGPIDKLWMTFIPYSVVDMFFSMAKMYVNFITFSEKSKYAKI